MAKRAGWMVAAVCTLPMVAVSCGSSNNNGDGGGADVVRTDGQNPSPDVQGATDGGGGTSGYFPPGAPWTTSIASAPLDSESAAVISRLQASGGWGLGHMQIDFSIEVLRADANTPIRPFMQTGDFFDPDCDPTPVPIPAGGRVEGESGYTCTMDGDCHLLVVHPPTHRLFEMWRANIDGSGTFYGGCLAVWDLTRVYPATGRGEQCTSADAGGFPIAPLLFTADEVAAGHIDHAIRFILPNARIRHNVYVHPGTHSTSATSGAADAPPYGARFRLRADFPLNTLPNEGARVVARALQTYGMFLADAGNVALTAQSDHDTTAHWDGLLGPRDLDRLLVTDFQMVDGGARIQSTNDCVRNP